MKIIINSTIKLVTLFAVFFLFMRIVMRLLGADVNNIFTILIYTGAELFKLPFLGIFPNLRLYQDASIDFVAIFALFAYLVIASVLLITVNKIASTSKQVS